MTVKDFLVRTRPRGLGRPAAFVGLAGLAALTACEPVEQLADRFRDLTPHEAYGASLAAAGLGETALARDWAAAGWQALESPAPVALPFEEEGFITPETPAATAYRVRLARGRKLLVLAALESEEDARIFVDLFRLPAREGDPPRPVHSAEARSSGASHRFEHEPWRGGDFVLRVQPELLRGGNYQVVLRQEAQMAFPVEGAGPSAVGSRFGASRDGGRRSHQGVDIFAPRGTPVLAASSGQVGRVSNTRLGGKVVWVRDAVRESSVYYAHLDSQHVRSGQAVETGDTLGFVGNTGNARTTPPHLHFGIYRRREGAVDPYPFLDPPRGALPRSSADPALLGVRVQPAGAGARLRAAPGTESGVLATLPLGAELRVVGAARSAGVAGSWYRVRTAAGREGYLAAVGAVVAGAGVSGAGAGVEAEAEIEAGAGVASGEQAGSG